MPAIKLNGCAATPFGGYLKALGVFRLVSEQCDPEARGWWDGDVFAIESKLTEDALVAFFLDDYRPTPIVAPWNGGSGFYPKDNKEGIDAISASTGERFAEYREAIETCRAFPEVAAGKDKDSKKEEERRGAILRRCRNWLSDHAVDWLDAAAGIAADGSRSFPPVLGTGGNEGRLDYTNNFMSRIAALLISLEGGETVRDLLRSALFGGRTTALQLGAAGQYDPGRAGGANQGPGVTNEALTNPWDLVLTLEGAVAWASGLYRRQGVGFRAVLCSPFTVYSSAIGYGSSAKKDDARAEVWTPLWSRPVRYTEFKTLLREGRASVNGRPAKNTVEFAEAASSLGVDRGIDRFVRYSLLKRRGDSYVALPTGEFPTGYRSKADLVREFMNLIEGLRDLPKGAEDIRREVDSAVYQALLAPDADSARVREMMAALGRLLRWIAMSTNLGLPAQVLPAARWLDACGFAEDHSVRIAAALASISAREVGRITENLSASSKRYAWRGSNLPERLISVLDRRLKDARALEVEVNPVRGGCTIDPGEATLFIEGSVDDDLIEDLLFAFTTLDWVTFKTPKHRSAEVLPTYAVLKCLFLAGAIEAEGEPKRLPADRRILSLLAADDISRATKIAVGRLRIAGLNPLDTGYAGGVDPRRLAASLLIPVWQRKLLEAGIIHKDKSAYA
jgi:CRISPR-associated protein Csx17